MTQNRCCISAETLIFFKKKKEEIKTNKYE